MEVKAKKVRVAKTEEERKEGRRRKEISREGRKKKEKTKEREENGSKKISRRMGDLE